LSASSSKYLKKNKKLCLLNDPLSKRWSEVIENIKRRNFFLYGFDQRGHMTSRSNHKFEQKQVTWLKPFTPGSCDLVTGTAVDGTPQIHLRCSLKCALRNSCKNRNPQNLHWYVRTKSIRLFVWWVWTVNLNKFKYLNKLNSLCLTIFHL